MESTHTPTPWNNTLERCQQYSPEHDLGWLQPTIQCRRADTRQQALLRGSDGSYENTLSRGVLGPGFEPGSKFYRQPFQPLLWASFACTLAKREVNP